MAGRTDSRANARRTASGEDADALRDVVDRVIDQWSAARPDVDASTIGVFGRITRAHGTASQLRQELHDRHGLTSATFDVLSSLRRAGAPYRQTAGELAAYSQVTSGGVTFRLDKMENEGLIRRTRPKADRRLVYAELTEAGLAKIDAVFEDYIALERRMLAGLTAEEQGELADLLRKLALSLKAVRASSDER